MPNSLHSNSIFESHIVYQWLMAGLPDELKQDPNRRNDAVVLSFILLCNFIACLIFSAILYVSFDSSPLIFEYGIPIILACIVNYIISALILVYVKSVIIAGNISLIGPYLSSVIGGWLTGGVFSPMLYLLIVPPVFAFMLTNVRSGVAWFALTISTFTGFWIVDRFGIYEPLFMITVDDYPFMQFILPVTTCFMLMVAVLIYEINSMKLKALLSQEKNVLAFKAAHDPLTGLANREEFNTKINIAIASARRSDYPLSLVYMDLDGFKPINDKMGHHAGDQVLTAISTRLKRLVRGTDTVARLGGDEFAIILQGVGAKEFVEPILQKVLDNVSAEVVLEDGTSVSVSASLGVSFLELQSKGVIDGDTLCKQADSAMYLAKNEKNTWRFFEQVVAPDNTEIPATT